MTTPIAIRLSHISKKYEIHHEKPTLVEKFVRGKNETFWALQDINLTIKRGERVGIIGPNGSGKTTLLKIIAGITEATAGTTQTRGKIVSLIDLGAGFHPDLTGVQNIYLNGMILGLKKQYIDRQFDDIVSFADIRQFIDTPLFTYSDGMKLRLGFAIAIHADPKILILDENIGVGDNDFQIKSERKIRELVRGGVTVLIVSQIVPFLAHNCSRILFMKSGRIVRDGELDILKQYQQGRI